MSDKTSNEHTEAENIQTGLGGFNFAGDDTVVPFQVEGLDVRGRAVQRLALASTRSLSAMNTRKKLRAFWRKRRS